MQINIISILMLYFIENLEQDDIKDSYLKKPLAFVSGFFISTLLVPEEEPNIFMAIACPSAVLPHI